MIVAGRVGPFQSAMARPGRLPALLLPLPLLLLLLLLTHRRHPPPALPRRRPGARRPNWACDRAWPPGRAPGPSTDP
ncbi:hypothetical protein, partial [Streptomyces sp. NPDC088270]|uniref:hypothetical protein n=1 Tax=Streptomyces sp. NPDC088270 TaxID=3160990 RepID=UPI0034404E6C